MIDKEWLNKKIELLDIGCGPGEQTIELCKRFKGNITAIDVCDSFLENLNNNYNKLGLKTNLKTQNHSMFELKRLNKQYDILWAEGSVFIIGIENALKEFKEVLKKDGIFVFSDLMTFEKEIPEEVLSFFEEEGAEVSHYEEIEKLIINNGYKVLNSYQLPEFDWWNYYIPVYNRINDLKEKYKDNKAALKELNFYQNEIEIYKKYKKYYGYKFYIITQSF